MERKLELFISELERIADLRNLDDGNPIVIRLSNPTVGTVVAVALSVHEPHTLILPLNVSWMNFDPASSDYKKVLRRVSKTDTPNDLYVHTWEEVTTMDQVWEQQYYDADDTMLLTGTDSVGPATETSLGTVRLSVASTTPSNPIVVAEGDPRLTDARTPLPHTHPQLPATSIKTASSFIVIDTTNDPVVGQVLVANSPTTCEWRKLTENDLAP